MKFRAHYVDYETPESPVISETIVIDPVRRIAKFTVDTRSSDQEWKEDKEEIRFEFTEVRITLYSLLGPCIEFEGESRDRPEPMLTIRLEEE